MAKKLNEISGFPQIQVALSGWQQIITLKKTTQSIVDGDLVQSVQETTFEGVIQPLTEEQIQLKPEGQRSWKWDQVHCYSGDLNLKTNDEVKFNNIDYKIMAVDDYSLNNYVEYHAVTDYQ